MYQISWDKKSLKDLKKLDKTEAVNLVNNVDSTLSKDPFTNTKQLKGSFKGLFRYRYKDYRVIFQIYALRLEIIIVRIGHRKDVYD